jgi:type IV pilus assembly protein PilP
MKVIMNYKKLATACMYGLLMGAFVLLAGCQDPPLQAPKKPVRAQVPAAAVQPQPAVLQESAGDKGYIYDQNGRRDPFMPLITPKRSVQPRDAVKAGTIESYDVKEFSLSAIVKKRDGNYALLVTPDNRSFTVSVGTLIGLHGGEVEEVTDDKVVLVENSKDYRGKLIQKKVTLEFHKGD